MRCGAVRCIVLCCAPVTAKEVIKVLLSCDEKELVARLTAHPELRIHLLSLVRRIPKVCVGEANALLAKLRDIPSSMVCPTASCGCVCVRVLCCVRARVRCAVVRGMLLFTLWFSTGCCPTYF